MRPVPWPSQCAVCRAWAPARVCRACLARFAQPRPRCAGCAAPSGTPLCGECLRAAPPFAHAVAAVDYAFPWDTLIAALKFRAALDLAGTLADLLAGAVRAAGVPAPDLLLAVPLGPARLRERGYNQAWELARRLARRVGSRAEAALLERHVDAPHQSNLARERREANVRGTFRVDAARGARLRGAHVALVDDVMTTGATAREAARTLLDAGARSVQVWAVARTPPP